MLHIILILTFSIFSLAQESRPEVSLHDLALKVKVPAHACPDKVWKGYDPGKNSRYVLNQPSKNKSLSIMEDGSIVEGTAEEWGEAGKSGYTYGKKANKKFVLINVEDESWSSEDAILETLFHEGYHFLGQSHIPHAPIDRFEEMPFDYEGRMAKTMQVRHLTKAIETRDAKEKELAIYWENWIKKNRPDDLEFSQIWDVIEGSAEYVGKRSLALTKLGCDASEEQISKFIISKLSETPETVDRSSQSYQSGLLGYTLAKLEENLKVFDSINKSPVSLLFENCETELKEEMDPSLKTEFEKNFSLISSVVEESIQEFKNTENILIVPHDSQAGTFSAMGMYKFEKKILIYPRFSAAFELPKGKITAKGTSAFNIMTENFCSFPTNGYAFAVNGAPRSDGNYGGLELSGNFEFVQQGTYEGKKIWCLKN